MKKYQFAISAEIEINAETPELAEKYLREFLDTANPIGSLYDIDATGHEVPNKFDLAKTYHTEYEVTIK